MATGGRAAQSATAARRADVAVARSKARPARPAGIGPVPAPDSEARQRLRSAAVARTSATGLTAPHGATGRLVAWSRP